MANLKRKTPKPAPRALDDVSSVIAAFRRGLQPTRKPGAIKSLHRKE